MAEKNDKLITDFTEQYIAGMENYYEQFWPSFQKMLSGTRFFKGTIQKYDDQELIKPCFFLWVIVCDIAGARHNLEGTPFLPAFDKAISKKLNIAKPIYDTWIDTTMQFFETIPMSGMKPPQFYALYWIIYGAFDRSFVYNPAEKRLILDAGYNMARTLYANSVLKSLAQ